MFPTKIGRAKNAWWPLVVDSLAPVRGPADEDGGRRGVGTGGTRSQQITELYRREASGRSRKRKARSLEEGGDDRETGRNKDEKQERLNTLIRACVCVACICFFTFDG